MAWTEYRETRGKVPGVLSRPKIPEIQIKKMKVELGMNKYILGFKAHLEIC
jgi:hypothetical protein